MPRPRCSKYCQREIAPGQDWRKRAEFRRQPDGEVKVFGEYMPDGPLAKATGTLVAVAHSKCYWGAQKSKKIAAAADTRGHELAGHPDHRGDREDRPRVR